MKNLIFILFFASSFLNAQFKEVEKESDGKIGGFYDKTRNAPFSLYKNENIYKICFYNTVSMNSDSQMICIPFEESNDSMEDFYNYVLNMFSLPDNNIEKTLETKRYKITIYKLLNSISLEFHDLESNIRNNKAITSTFMKKDWESLFGKK